MSREQLSGVHLSWNQQTPEEPVIPKRSSTKGEIQQWLRDREIGFPEKFVKAQLLKLVCANCPHKEYMVSHFFERCFEFFNSDFPLCSIEYSDRIAKRYAVEIIRLPKLHCSLNPIELSWNNPKQFVRGLNTTFRQDDVKQLVERFIVVMDDKLVSSYFHHVYGIEEMYKIADAITEEEIEPHLQSDSEETDSDDDEEDVEL